MKLKRRDQTTLQGLLLRLPWVRTQDGCPLPSSFQGQTILSRICEPSQSTEAQTSLSTLWLVNIIFLGSTTYRALVNLSHSLKDLTWLSSLPQISDIIKVASTGIKSTNSLAFRFCISRTSLEIWTRISTFPASPLQFSNLTIPLKMERPPDH